MKLLIVDDSAPMRHLIRAVVGDLADDVTECSDGDEAVEAYTAHRFGAADRVLMDMQMARVSGLEATRRIRANFPDARIIIVTQYDDPEWRAAADEAGACGYVLKDDLRHLRQSLQLQPRQTQ
jgi:CheY-like chemotaxis protein